METVAQKASEWGFDGLELACWGDHFEAKSLTDDGYLRGRHALLDKYHLKCFAISKHLVGQCVCDNPIDSRIRQCAAASGLQVLAGPPPAIIQFAYPSESKQKGNTTHGIT